jgi:hypothetical protein
MEALLINKVGFHPPSRLQFCICPNDALVICGASFKAGLKSTYLMLQLEKEVEKLSKKDRAEPWAATRLYRDKVQRKIRELLPHFDGDNLPVGWIFFGTRYLGLLLRGSLQGCVNFSCDLRI